jgi:hypothetical protein
MGSADAVAQYEAASAVGDIDALMKTLAPDAELISPLVASAVIRGHKDLRVLLEAVYTTVHDLRWNERLGDDHTVVMIGEAKVGPFRIGDAAVIELAQDGSIRRVRPHLRPWLATTFFALRVLLKVARHPGLLRRSWRPAYIRAAYRRLRPDVAAIRNVPCDGGLLQGCPPRRSLVHHGEAGPGDTMLKSWL